MKNNNWYCEFFEWEDNYSDLKKQPKKNIYSMILEEYPSLEILIKYACSSSRVLPEHERLFHSKLYSTIKSSYILAKKFGLDVEESIEESVIGLLEWTQKRGPLSNYPIFLKIYNTLIRTLNSVIYYPAHIVEYIRIIKKNAQYLENVLRRSPTLEEIGIVSGMSCERVEYFIRLSRRPILFSELSEEYGSDMFIGDIIDSETLTTNTTNPTEEQVDALFLEDLMLNLVQSLPPSEQIVIILRYGLLDGKYKTLEEVGKYFNLQRERIRQIEKNALRKLRNSIRVKHSKEFFV